MALPAADNESSEGNSLHMPEEMFQALFRNSPDALFLTAAEDGTVIDINDSFSELVGYSREECIGRSLFDLGLCPDAVDLIALVAELKAKGRGRVSNY